MTKKTKVTKFQMLTWTENNRTEEVAGPGYALEDEIKRLKKAGIEYDLEDVGEVEEVQE